ncbi:efflux RND transporter periplasmic adaptor subunit [Mucilaginibacter conchicola]|uniref:Efflux RND transporter periplasmic adaptor subunit n=1 Tax=Mucilaginibacter conchicola TaxID=2303333 RepID=A0A372NSA2_9SPHI|nr:efflux RND transporter periplasmic adaptor subunit [Mucilaginibacter conchicola]RFZ91143.1 efflux RND transporter periplasmic adaptor subunit [Mucilaginibacter conchicola]
MKNITLYSLLAIALAGCSRPSPQQPVPESLPVSRVASGSAVTYQEYPATLEGAVNVEIRPQIEGILEKTFVDEGAYVRKGQPLFAIDDRPLRQKLASAAASVLSMEGNLNNARLEVEKLIPLVQNKVVADYQLKAAKAVMQTAEGNLAQARAQLGSARIDLGYTVIKAPAPGYIGRLPKKQGSIISPADVTALTLLSDTRFVRAYFSLGEEDFVNFKEQYPGNGVRDKLQHLAPVKLLLANKTVYGIPGRVDMVDGQFDPRTAAITLRATFSNEQGLLKTGNTGKVKMALVHADVIQVPASATVDLQDKIFVYVVGSDHKVRRKFISVTGKNGDKYLVGGGLTPGELIVLSGFDRLQDGALIKPVETKLQPEAIARN